MARGPTGGTVDVVGKLGWIFGDGVCGAFGAHTALFAGHRATIRRVACGPPTTICICPIQRSLWGYDATPVLRQFAREMALSTTSLWNPPPVVLRFLKTGDESIRGATNAALRHSVDGDSPAAWGAWSAWAATWPDAIQGARTAAAHAIAIIVGGVGATAGKITTRNTATRKQSKRLEQLLAAGRKLYSQKAVP